jgi:formimidoylglutamate deiminase
MPGAEGHRRDRLVPHLLWQDGRFHAGLAVDVDDDGRIAAVRDAAHGRGRPGEVRRLAGRALLPGFVNAHSHAFQRLLRGRTQWRPLGDAAADFWTWREAMYDLVLGLDEERLARASRACFAEMLRAGFTTVGEFHYVHRLPDGSPADPPDRLARVVVEAAREVGIRIVLLHVAYATGGIGAALEPRQRRFATPDLDGYLAELDRLADALGAEGGPGANDGLGAGGGRATVGAAPHSVRAVPREWLGPIAAWSEERRAPLHMHVAEQPAEVEACLAAYGASPLAVLAEEGVLSPRFTAVHATHIDAADAGLLAASGASVCACPTTERDLADGFLPLELLRPASVPIALGTDSNAVIDPFEEMRCVEYHERLRTRRRVVVADPAQRADGGPPDRLACAPALLDMGTRHGARSLGVEAGAIETGRLADLVAVDLDHPTLDGHAADTLAAMLVFGAPPSLVRDVWVGGREIPLDRI